MSIESAKAFIEKVKSDEDFKKNLGGLKDGQARLDFAKKAGFNFTAADLAKVKEEQGLTDEELDGVAGGCGGADLCLEGIGDSSISLW
ncbi:MAG TPA: Nif11-like leader peptide family natural product precursor [Bacillota bacterium]|nr:Nif11-like leader peptide family natural product precursor [Bacillota bacterium]